MRRLKNQRLRELLEFAESLGFKADRTNSGHMKFYQPGCQPIYTSSTPSDGRAYLNARSDLRKAAKSVKVA